MTPTEPPEYDGTQRLVWKGPDPTVADLVVRFDLANGESISMWDLSFDERAAILDGARIILSVVGRHPPVGLSVEGVSS